MELVYYRKSVPNFGDDLNADIWPALAPDLFDGDGTIGFVGIGTIIGMPCGERLRLNVFSSGVGNDKLSEWAPKDVRYWCVRGPISARALSLEEDAAITDGAILTPLIKGFPTKGGGGRSTVIVPHFQTIDHPGWQAAAAEAGFELIDPRDPPQEVIAKIANARRVLTESLHGAILADTYGVPWTAFATSGNFAVAKWADWTLSLKRDFRLVIVPPPEPTPILTYGRPPGPFGSTLRFGAEDAMKALEDRVAGPPREVLKARLKAILKRTPFAGALLGLSVSRTAKALVDLSRAEPELSGEGLRDQLRDRMLERLSAVQQAYREDGAASLQA